MKIFHSSDWHYCAKHLTWVDRAVGFSIDYAIEAGADVAVISGDLSDAAMGTHEEAFEAMLGKVRYLANCMPVIILQGTYSHDRPGSLAAFKMMGTLFPIYVAEKVEQDQELRLLFHGEIVHRIDTLSGE